jgi:hypothetical protein
VQVVPLIRRSRLRAEMHEPSSLVTERRQRGTHRCRYGKFTQEFEQWVIDCRTARSPTCIERQCECGPAIVRGDARVYSR